MKYKNWIIAGTASLIVGLALCGFAYSQRGEDLLKYTTISLEGPLKSNPYSKEEHMYAPDWKGTQLVLDLDVADVELVKGNEFKIETWNLPEMNEDSNKIQVSDQKNNDTYTLKIKEEVHTNLNDDLKVKITIPDSIQSVTIDSALGSVEMKEVRLKNLDLDLALGNVEINRCTFNTADLELSLGDLDVLAAITVGMDAHLAMGDASITLQGDPKTYSIDAQCSMGEVSVEESHNGPVLITVENNMGDIDVEYA